MNYAGPVIPELYHLTEHKNLGPHQGQTVPLPHPTVRFSFFYQIWRPQVFIKKDSTLSSIPQIRGRGRGHNTRKPRERSTGQDQKSQRNIRNWGPHHSALFSRCVTNVRGEGLVIKSKLSCAGIDFADSLSVTRAHTLPLLYADPENEELE